MSCSISGGSCGGAWDLSATAVRAQVTTPGAGGAGKPDVAADILLLMMSAKAAGQASAIVGASLGGVDPAAGLGTLVNTLA